MNDPGSALVYYVVFLFSTTVHEAAHAWAAMRGGDLTAYHGGQVSLDPIPHIRREPFGMVALPVVSLLISGWPFGFASAPFNRRWAMRYPRRAAWMALAGPASNLSLVVISLLVIRFGSALGVLAAPASVRFDMIATTELGGFWEGVAFVLSVFFSLNLLLCVFNLIPLPPLDGSAAPPLLLGPRATATYQRILWDQPMLTWMGILLAWQIFPALFYPIWFFAVNLVHSGVTYG